MIELSFVYSCAVIYTDLLNSHRLGSVLMLMEFWHVEPWVFQRLRKH